MSDPFSLFKYDDEYLSLLAQIEEAGGEITPEQEATLDALAAKVAEYTDRYVAFIDLTEKAEANIDAWIARWKHKKEMLLRERDRFKKAIVQRAEDFGVNRFSGEHRNVVIKQAESVEVDNPESLPEAYRRTKIIIEPDKVKIKAALKEGVELPAHIVVKKYPQIF